MVDTRIMYGCCVGSWDKFTRWVARPDREIMALSGQQSISVAYNQVLDFARGLMLVDMVVLLHDDLEIIDPDAEQKLLDAVRQPNVAIAGVAGGGPSMSWWNVDPIGHQLTDSGLLQFDRWPPDNPDVHVVEGSIMAFSPWAIAHLRFDERYEFLGYDDVCLAAKDARRRVVVADVDTHHHSTVGYKNESVRQMWERSEKIWHEKWGSR